MASNPYRDFGLHPGEYGPQSPSGSSAPGSALRKWLSWKSIGTVLFVAVVVIVPKLFLANEVAKEIKQEAKQRKFDEERKAQEARRRAESARQLQADIEAVRAGKKKAGQAFHRLFDIPETPDNTIGLPAPKPPAKDAG